MRRRPLFWICLSVLCFVSAGYFWYLGDQWAAKRATKAPPPASPATNQKPVSTPGLKSSVVKQAGASQQRPLPNLIGGSTAVAPSVSGPNPLPYRLSNTDVPIGELSRNQSAILLENALLDTTRGTDLKIPEQLRSSDPGAYIVQSRGNLDDRFRSAIISAGASIVSYIPKNAYLVRASSAAALRLGADPLTQAVVPYEPYFKLKPSLLKLAVEQTPLPPLTALNLLLFADGQESTLNRLTDLGVQVLAHEQSAIGPVVRVRPPANALVTLAALPGVQVIERVNPRIAANDLSRAALGVAVDSIAPTNYLNLTGTNVMVTVNDTGVDDSHPALTGRVLFDPNYRTLDTEAHGTHVAGIIIGNGAMSQTVSNAPGSIMPPATNQFRGMAPGARIYSIKAVSDVNVVPSDVYLEESAATNGFLSNNSWTYDDNEYDLAAASYDAAVRDALPTRPGSQPVMFIFPTGNAGELNSYLGGVFESGRGGNPDTILSPATAKNVLTIGAVEQPRNITNEVVIDGVTNAIWAPMTDSADEVAGYSGRGNVGVGIEGDAGRFKPDLVARGSFVISTASTNWDKAAYYSPLGRTRRLFPEIVVGAGETWSDTIFIPEGGNATVQLLPNRFSPNPFPDVPIYISSSGIPGPGDPIGARGTNVVNFPSSPSGPWFFTIENTNMLQDLSFDLLTQVSVPTDAGGVGEVLSNLNNQIGPFYRYESGTSMASAEGAGTLALVQEFLRDWAGKRTNSPAFLKALLINGARSVGNQYDFQVASPINYQGWGIINLPNSARPAMTNATDVGSSILAYEQNPTNALATGQSHTRQVTVDDAARTLPMRVTLVWSDPPANPAASIKLVNDLDLVVTNLDTKEVYFGNDILAGNDFNAPWNTNVPPTSDVINNVENVFIPPNLGTNYSITVIGKHVNVNAVRNHPTDVVQDYALVISSGNGEVTNAFKVTESAVVSETRPTLTAITNMFAASPGYSGGIVTHQHVGANSPLLGTNQLPTEIGNGVFTLGVANQWHFYVITNDTDYTNAAFLTFLPPNLALPRMGVTNESSLPNASRPEADIDLYVSTDGNLTNLTSAVLSGALRSLGPGGTETIVITNATRGAYYIGVKSEDQQSAEYSILGVFSESPFSENENGNLRLHGFPLFSEIPDGTPQRPGGTYVFAIAAEPIKIHRVIVSNTVIHELFGDLVGTLSHSGTYATLNNHSTNNAPGIRSTMFIYDDSGERNVQPYSQGSDGPGTLMDFGGQQAAGQWLLTMIDNAPTHIGTNIQMTIFLEKQQDPQAGITATILPGACRTDFLDVPGDATNLTVSVGIISGNAPLTLDVCGPDGSCQSIAINNGVGGQIVTDFNSIPPLRPGTYSIRVCNQSTTQPVTVHILARLYINPNSIPISSPNTATNVAIRNDAITYAEINVTNHQVIAGLDVGLLINHPRVSDLALTLISPNGTRVLLFENRGAWSTTGLGSFGLNANNFGYSNITAVARSDFDDALVGPYAPSARFKGWQVISNTVAVASDYSYPWRENHVLLLNDGAVSWTVPITNITDYRLDMEFSRAPFIVGTVGWWPLDGDGTESFLGNDALLAGDVRWNPGRVGGAFFGDGVATRMVVPACSDLNVGLARGFTIEGWIYPSNATSAAPLVEWVTSTNPAVMGVQLGTASLPAGGAALRLIIPDLAGTSNSIDAPLPLVNNGWQHVAVTFDTNTGLANFYLNGAAVVPSAPIGSRVPRTWGDLYFGYHPPLTGAGPAGQARAFSGGMDEFGIYERALSSCEIAAIYNAGARGKYGTNALTCPVGFQLASTAGGPSVVTVSNRLNWAAGPIWETNSIYFKPGSTNPITFTLRALDPNVAIDNVVLWARTTNFLDGLLHFNDDTNLALVPIKFAPSPYQVSVFDPELVYSNDVESALAGTYLSNSIVPGANLNSPGMPWRVTQGSVTVVSNAQFAATGRKLIALAEGAVQTTLPTVPGERYELRYNVRGPAAVGWWNGIVNPLNRRAFDMIGGNDGAFLAGATNTSGEPQFFTVNDAFETVVGGTGLRFPGMVVEGVDLAPSYASKIEIGDPENLRLTNALTIEAWIKPEPPANGQPVPPVQQIFFRGDSRDGRDPYYLALRSVGLGRYNLHFHVEGDNLLRSYTGVITTNAPIGVGEWHHVAAVYESGVPTGTNAGAPLTNEFRLYLDGQRLTNSTVARFFTGEVPDWSLEPSFSPGVAIGNRSRSDATEPFVGAMDEVTVYGRALTDPEIAAIAAAGSLGKADPSIAPAQSLAKVALSLDNVVRDTTHADNSRWTSRSFKFTATRTNILAQFQGLLPGTLIDGIQLYRIPAELSYQPEQALDILNGEDAFGTWRLEMWDTRTGEAVGDARLVQWQLDFRLAPSNPAPVIELSHGIPYMNTLPAYGVQHLIVDVPQWASFATNNLFYTVDRLGNPVAAGVGVLYGTNVTSWPFTSVDALVWPPAPTGFDLLSSTSTPRLNPGLPYFLTVTNPSPIAVTYSFGVSFDITTLSNCQPSAAQVSVAGVPRYFQFDVPETNVDAVPHTVSFWLYGANSNVTVVLSQSLPLPDLTHYDYISQQPCTNDEIVMLVTNSTPFPIQTNRWYVGVFNSAEAPVAFTTRACYNTNEFLPFIVPLSNGVPFRVARGGLFSAPPGPPQRTYFEFDITNFTDAVLFEIYNPQGGDPNLVLQRDLPPTMAPYWATSTRTGTNNEQIVVRMSRELADIRGKWFLGVYNTGSRNVGFTIRATTRDMNGLLLSAVPTNVVATPYPGGGTLLTWNSVVGENYEIRGGTTQLGFWTATTPISTWLTSAAGPYYVVPRPLIPPENRPPLWIQLTPNNTVRLWWTNSVPFVQQYLLYSPNLRGRWFMWPDEPIVTGNTNTVIDVLGDLPTFYRLFP